MSSVRKAKILIVDDESESANALALKLRSDNLEVLCQAPLELSGKVVAECDLVLLDLDLGTETKSGFPDLEAPDGLALASILRRQTSVRGKNAPPVAFALLSGKVKELADPFPTTDRIVLLAQQHNLEWIFPKSDAGTSVSSIASLANAVRDIPKDWANGVQDFSELAKLFGVAEAEDIEVCWEEIEKCHPPTHEVTQWTHGLALIRWLMHKILCYPCFLWDSHRVAARLRISHSSFLTGLEDRTSQLKTLLAEADYTGVLSDFSNRRWWRHRVERLAWTLTEGDSQNTTLLRESLAKKSAYNFAPSDVERPLVCVDADYKTLEKTMSVENAVRVQPDDWPSFADAAWMPLELVAQDKALRQLVVHEDRDRLPAEASKETAL